jgi:uncharacterized protein (DUF362 family)
MIWTRREFLGSLGAATVRPAPYFGVHPFIEANPKAVFIHRTKVPHKMDRPAKLQAGLELGRQIFVPLDTPGVPVTHRVVLKPNVISVRSRTRPDEENWGTGTDPDFYEGIVMALKERGVRQFSFVEANLRWAWNYRGFVDINDRHGIEMNDPEIRPAAFHRTGEIVWSEVPEAVVYKRIPHYWPVNAPDTWLLNIAKWKAHGMCLTQSVKNEQGLVVTPYVRFCPGWSNVTGAPPVVRSGICPDVEARVLRYFESHRKMGYYRYDQPAKGSYPDPLAHEIWCQKTCDNQSVLKTGLAMIEGIYGRDGDGFHVGNDYLTNLVLFSKDKFRLDVIGLWLGGHEPGNVHLYRVAKERGLSDTFNPWEIPIYEWIDGRAVPRKLTDFPRTPLRSPYMRQGSETLHLADEPFDYDKYKL